MYIKNFKFKCSLTKEFIWTWLAFLFILFASGMAAFKIMTFDTNQVVACIYALCFLIFFYGNIYYLLCRWGHLQRKRSFKPASDSELETIFHQDAKTVTFLLPSYKEDLRVIRQSLFSAALQDYPHRRVVLLIDDPAFPANPSDRAALESAQQEVVTIQEMLRALQLRFQEEYDAFFKKDQIDLEADKKSLFSLYEEAIFWFKNQGEKYSIEDHTDVTFVHLTFSERAKHLQKRLDSICQNLTSKEQIQYEYYRLACMFNAHISSFERKRYENLSHASNKAMNLNSYIGLMGKNLMEVATPEGLHLIEASEKDAQMRIPDSHYVAMLDADSVLTFDYTLKLVHVMESHGNEKLAIIQTPYSAFPNPKETLEKIAGATTDIGYNIHQGLSYFNSAFWVGANAIARKQALEEIAEKGMERGFAITRFIQDRTVIEDTESTIDLVARGWSLINYPERLSFSATPPDFGSLLIQRRRWANGGLLILPKLLKFMFSRPWSLRKFTEGFFRFHYLFSISGMIMALLVLSVLPMQEEGITLWMVLSSLPYFAVYARDLKLQGYLYSDLIRVAALNLLLIPVNAAGVLKSLQQAITGKQTPFCRTPKIQGRTTVSAFYVALEYGLLLYYSWGVMSANTSTSALLLVLLFLIPFVYALVKFMGLSESYGDILPFFRKFQTRKAQELEASL